ncbi:hypothetical protein JMN32_17515 [Fulvivirga sp. 29W222]|uniref:Uncharacterized protein n=1 Tax=Fulvivirga marina TaxID=2494733 RepID=A0A937G468_9BACT|nr:hypothetical protein [Fulvivirga marina]MBL6448121.1 hypothetical protein [Fulvivirga marina]
MIALKPQPYADFCCPQCDSQVEVETGDVRIAGMHSYIDCTCRKCGFSFYQMLPVGHHVEVPFAIAKDNLEVYHHHQDYQWLAEIVQQAFPPVKREVSVERRIFKVHHEVVILNALDFLYGHSLLKLYNAQHHLDNHPSLGLILIIPQAFEWMVPAGCAEAWIVDLKLGELKKSYSAISEFVSAQFQRFGRIYLSNAYSHPDFTKVDIRRFTGVEPFHIENFTGTTPRVTFVLREDRWWHPHQADHWFYRVCRKIGWLKMGGKLLSKRQKQLVESTIRYVQKELPDTEFYIVGLGTIGSFNGTAHDSRVNCITTDVEREWCDIYSKSHVVVGFHGSNMLLPTAFSAGCVEILPEDRFGNMVQDLSVRYNDRRQLFFYRFSDQYSKPSDVAAKVVAMIRDYAGYYRNMCKRVYTSGE